MERRFFLRPCRPLDLPAMGKLFYDTVHTICAADYTPAQLEAWAPSAAPDWDPDFWGGTALAAEAHRVLLGFASILPGGYLGLLFVHKDYQGRGIASALCGSLERVYPVRRIVVHASITARPFFEKRGYHAVHANQVERRGQVLKNYTMEKELI